MSRKERLEQLGDQPRKFTNVYVKNFSEDMAEDDLRKLFEPYGDIQSLKIMCHEDGRSKCFGFVSFGDPESAHKVKNEEDIFWGGYPLSLSKEWISWPVFVTCDDAFYSIRQLKKFMKRRWMDASCTVDGHKRRQKDFDVDSNCDVDSNSKKWKG